MTSMMVLHLVAKNSPKILLYTILFFASLNVYSQELEDESLDSTSGVERGLASKSGEFTVDKLDVMRKIENIGNGNKDNLVIVEPRNIIPARNTSKLEMIPYRLRRHNWGHMWGVSYGLYTPNNYLTDQFELAYEDIYPSGGDLGLLQVEIILKRNYDSFSLGGYFSAGYFGVESDIDDIASELTIVPIKLGFYGSLDTLWREPWVVPYAHGGIYSTYFDEKTDGNSFNGTTLLAFYVAGGVLMQLDWIDDSTAREAYVESGIENTFIFLEANYLSASIEEKDPDFDAIYFSAGLKIEF